MRLVGQGKISGESKFQADGRMTEWIKKKNQDPFMCCLQEIHFRFQILTKTFYKNSYNYKMITKGTTLGRGGAGWGMWGKKNSYNISAFNLGH